MDFCGDILSFIRPEANSFSLVGIRLPSSRDAYYLSKKREIVEQYSAARLFLDETETTDWDHWFNPMQDKTFQQIAELTLKAYFYETALVYYNIVIDLSWTACYLATEFALTQKGERIDFGGIIPVDEAYALMRKAENLVTNPTAEDNPFGYLKRMCPEFSAAIDLIISFWENFMQSDIRQRYNYCKHKGKPSYTEIEVLTDASPFEVYLQNDEGTRMKIITDPKEVRLRCGLNSSITELLSSDNEILFPYISELFNEIDRVLNPSPLI